jgi:hypothetical protein
MKHLNNYYKFFTILKEQQEVPDQKEKQKVPGQEEVFLGGAKPTDVPKWFQDVFYGEGPGKKGSARAFGAKSLKESWINLAKYIDNNKLGVELDKITTSKKKMIYIQNFMWKNINMKSGTADEPSTVLQDLNKERAKFQKQPLRATDGKKFADGRFGTQTEQVMVSLTFADPKTPQDEKEKIKNDVLGAKEEPKKEEPKKEEPAKEEPKKEEPTKDQGTKQPDMQKVADEGTTGLNPAQLKTKAETIIRDSFIPDESEKSDKFKMGANKLGARIVYKDKGDSKITPEDLAVLDEYFGQDGFVRTKTKEKGGILRDKFMKYVWTKKLKTQSKEATPNTAGARDIEANKGAAPKTAAQKPAQKPAQKAAQKPAQAQKQVAAKSVGEEDTDF